MSGIVRLPRMLNADLSEKARPVPSKLPMTIETYGVSTAQMTLGEDQPDVKLHDIFELYTIDGSVGLFRATNTAWTVRNSRVITLRHCRDTFADSVWTRPDGTNLDYNGTVPDFLAEIISRQVVAYWQLGICEDVSAWKKSGIYYTRLSDLIDELEKKHKDYIFTYDFSTTPWTLNYVHAPSDIAEFRLSRNITGCKISYDDESLCNKLYMTWSVDTEDGQDQTILTFEDSTSQIIYGIIEKTVDVKESDEPSAEVWAADFLETYSNPSIQISIDGANFSALTGVALDEASRGKMARIALPDYGVTVNERLIAIKYTDALNEPYSISAELSNNVETISSTLAQIQKTAKTGSDTARGAADRIAAETRRASKTEDVIRSELYSAQSDMRSVIIQTASEIRTELWAADSKLFSWISQTASEIRSEVATTESDMRSVISQTASAIRTELWAADSKLSSSITQTASSIRSEVSNAESGLYSAITQTASSIRSELWAADSKLFSKITQTASSIRSEVASADSSLYSSITQTASSIRSELWAADSKLSSSITQTANSIRSEISNSESGMYSAITQTASSIRSELWAADSSLWSSVTANASSITSKVGKGEVISCINQTAETISISASKINLSGYVTATEFNATKAKIDNLTGGTIVESFCKASLLVGTTVTANNTFTHDGDTIYKRAMRWSSGGTIIATVHATGDTTSIILSHSHAVSVDSSGNVSIGNAQSTTGSFNIADTAFYQSAVSAAEEDGWDLARSFVSPPSGNTSSSFDFGVPSVTYNRSSSYTYTVSCDNNYAYIKNAANVTVARVSNNAYDNGWDAARNQVSPPSAGTTSSMTVGIPASTVGQSSSYTFTLSCDSSYAYIKNAVGTTVARVSNPVSYSSSDLHITKSGSYIKLYLGNNVISRTAAIAVTGISRYSTSQYYVSVLIDGDTTFNLLYSGSIS